jgi:hypothetical protein
MAAAISIWPSIANTRHPAIFDLNQLLPRNLH